MGCSGLRLTLLPAPLTMVYDLRSLQSRVSTRLSAPFRSGHNEYNESPAKRQEL